jgi:hypothetical protein
MMIASLWYPSSNYYSNPMAMVFLLSVAVCYIATRPAVRDSVLGEALIIIGAPVLFFTAVVLSEGGMLIFKDGGDFGFPMLIRSYPGASDFIAAYIALGASYLLARQASQLRCRGVRLVGRIEAAGFALIAGLELFLLERRLWMD